MVDGDMDEKVRDVEKYITGWYTEPDMLKILCVKAVPAVPPGENFLSFIWRIEMKVQLKSGDVMERKLIFKNMAVDEGRREIVLNMNIFTREITTYELLLAKMDQIMTEFKIDCERSWPNLISHRDYEVLLLEDLQPLGYYTVDKMEGLSLQEAELVFKALGRFHAASKAALNLDRVKISDIPPRMICSNPKYIENFYVKPVRFLSQSINPSWGSQWKELQAKLNVPAEQIINKIKKAVEVDETKFNTILHGDMWSNNVMICNDSSGKPKSVKFIDFQLSFYATIAWDLTYLSYTSLSHSIRKHHLNNLLKIYSSFLQEDLRHYGYPTDKIPTDELVLNEMDRLRFWSFMVLIFYVPLFLSSITGDSEDSDLILHPSPNVTKVPSIYRSEVFRNTVGYEIIELINGGVMD